MRKQLRARLYSYKSQEAEDPAQGWELPREGSGRGVEGDDGFVRVGADGQEVAPQRRTRSEKPRKPGAKPPMTGSGTIRASRYIT